MATVFTLALMASIGALEITALIPTGQAQKSDAAFRPQIPKSCDDEALRSWALPLTGLGEAPTYVYADYYYRMPERKIYRSYPVYALGKEPPGYLGG
jgi:hypothetical protein